MHHAVSPSGLIVMQGNKVSWRYSSPPKAAT